MIQFVVVMAIHIQTHVMHLHILELNHIQMVLVTKNKCFIKL